MGSEIVRASDDTPNAMASRYFETMLRMVFGVMPGGPILTEAFFDARARREAAQFQSHMKLSVECLEDRVEELQAAIRDFQARAEERARDQEAQDVAWNYTTEAVQEAIKERREMLAHAQAALLDVRISVASHARVQRRLHEIEPRDVLALYAVSRTYERVFNGRQYRDQEEMRTAFVTQIGARDALQSAGCIRFTPGPSLISGVGNPVMTPERLVITDFGDLVLQVLAGFIKKRELPFTIPGREHVDGERPHDEAVQRIADVAPLRETLSAIVLKHPREHLRFQASCWWPGEKDQSGSVVFLPPRARGLTRISIDGISREEAETLFVCSPKPAGELPQFGQPFEDVVVERGKTDGTETWFASISGPHDVLRVLADDLDIRWF